MKRAIATLACSCAVSALAPACGTNAATIGPGKKLVVTITKGDVGSLENPLAVSVHNTSSFTVSVEAQLPDGTTDTSFNGYVNLTVQPGTVTDLTVRNEKLTSGKIDGVVLPVVGAFGEAHIWATDLGYEPAAPNRMPPPQCADGIDNNNNGLIDYPADPGCYAPVDDTEDGGTYAAGVSEALHYELPRIALVRGYDPPTTVDGNATSFPQQQISIDTGWRGGENYAFSTVVIGLTAAGFYAQDLQDDKHPAPGYGGIYAYNFSTPPFMRVCDRVQILSGTSSDFYGFTEINYPAWQLEYWNPMTRPCLVPEPTVLGPSDVISNTRLWQLEATLGRVQTTGTLSVHVAKHFGPGDVQVDNAHCATGQAMPCYVPDATHSNCDFDHNGKVNYNDPAESACAAACAGSCSPGPHRLRVQRVLAVRVAERLRAHRPGLFERHAGTDLGQRRCRERLRPRGRGGHPTARLHGAHLVLLRRLPVHVERAVRRRRDLLRSWRRVHRKQHLAARLKQRLRPPTLSVRHQRQLAVNEASGAVRSRNQPMRSFRLLVAVSCLSSAACVVALASPASAQQPAPGAGPVVPPPAPAPAAPAPVAPTAPAATPQPAAAPVGSQDAAPPVAPGTPDSAAAPPNKADDPGYDVLGTAGARAVGMAPPGTRPGDFMDTRVSWTFGDDDFLHPTGSSSRCRRASPSATARSIASSSTR